MMNTPIQQHSSPLTLRTSLKMPCIFVGHGSPMNAIEDNEFRRTWQKVGSYFGQGQRWPKPQLILCVSAHWLTRGWGLTAMDHPPTIHDFGGFPAELHAQQYPAPGAPGYAEQISKLIQQPAPGQSSLAKGEDLFLDRQEWGFDHGTWSVLKPMFPEADIPVIQMSIDYSADMNTHFELGRQLSALRELGVLIIGSGNTVHNLRAMNRSAANTEAFDWNKAFDDWVASCINEGDLKRLMQFQSLGDIAKLAHPSYEHYLPILYVAGAAREDDRVEYFSETYQAKSVAMRSVIWY